MNLTTIIRTAVRVILIQQGPQTCSDIVRSMGLDPQRHKGTIHAVMAVSYTHLTLPTICSV